MIDRPLNLGLLTFNAFRAAPVVVLVVVSTTDRIADKGAMSQLATADKLCRKAPRWP